MALFAAYVACRHLHLGISGEAGPALISSLSATVYIIYQSAIGNTRAQLAKWQGVALVACMVCEDLQFDPGIEL